MEGSTQKNEELEQKKDRFRQDLVEEEYRQSSSSSDFSTSEATGNGQEEAQSHSSFDESSSSHCTNSDASDLGKKPYSNDRKLLLENHGSYVSETDMMMRDRFAKLLLGEDMSGCGNGVSSALAISNAITNVCATLFGQLWRLEPLPAEQKSMWRREMELLLCVSDHIVELIPSWQTFSDGTKLEVMACRPRSDLCISLPALRKLDNMLMEILDSFENTDFWYVDQGIPAPKADGSSTFRRPPLRQEEKWWLPVPQVSPRGLLDDSRKQLQHKRDCASQILKAAMTINNTTLEEMDIPQAYFENLPRNGRAILGDIIYRYITSEQFTPECLLDCLDISSEHRALETANRVEASISIWRRGTNTGRSIPKSSWEMVKELMFDGDRRETLAGRAQRLLLCLKQRFPGLPQTALETSKIQCNKDVGKSILESYSRVLESLAFTITARIDDVFYVDDLAKCSNQFSSAPEVGAFAPKSVSTPCSVPFLSTPYRTAFTSPNFSPAKVEGAPYVSSSQLVKTGLNSFSIPSPELGASMAVAGSYYHGTGDDVCRAIQESVVSDEP